MLAHLKIASLSIKTMVVASSTSTCSPQTQPLLKSDENEGAHSLQCPVSETVDSPRIIIADWADGRGKGGDEVFHSEFTQRSMVRYPQTTQHSSAALTDSLNFWSGQIQPEHFRSL